MVENGFVQPLADQYKSGTELSETQLFLGTIPNYMQYFGQKWDFFCGDLLHNPISPLGTTPFVAAAR